MRKYVSVLAATILWLVGAAAAAAHEGHDHGTPPSPVGTNEAPRAEASSDAFEIVAIARGGELEIALDTFRGNEPVETAAIEVDSPSGLLRPSHRGNGIYTVAAPFLGAPGRYDLAFTVAAAGQVDVLTATIAVPKKPAPQPQPLNVVKSVVGELGGRDVTVGLAALLLATFAAGFAAARVGRRGVAAIAVLVFAPAMFGTPVARAGSAEAALITMPAPPVARDVARRLPDGAVFVPKSTQRILAVRTLLTTEAEHARTIELPGRIIPDVNASGLVQASVGGRLSPPAGGFKPLGTSVRAGDILAYVRPPLPSADATVQAQQARELDQQIAIVTRKVERLSAIQPIIAKSQLEDAQLELSGLKERRANLDRVNREPEPLHAPVGGVIAAANAVAGQMAEPSSVIFQIVDPARLWVEALAFEPQGLTSEATARLADGRLLRLTYLGTGIADRNQAVPVQFAVVGDARGLRSGQFLTVFARSSEVRKGIALPRSAVLRNANGQAVVYEHANAERFVPREVRTVGLDGERVLVVAGLDTGKRVVTQGAELLDQIR